MNRVILTGRLGQDPEPIANGTKFNLATKDFNGTEETTTWSRIVVFGNQADTAQKYLKKGDQVLVEGRLNNRKNEETKTTQTSIIASRVEFLSQNAENTITNEQGS